MSTRRGFTLIELLLVIAIIAILASIVVVALNPMKELSGPRDTQRRSDVNTILNAVFTYAIEHDGALPGNITTTPREICRFSTEPAVCIADNGVNLRMLSGGYLASLPGDPQAPSSSTGTHYVISQDSNGRVTVTAPNTELEETDISVTR